MQRLRAVFTFQLLSEESQQGIFNSLKVVVDNELNFNGKVLSSSVKDDAKWTASAAMAKVRESLTKALCSAPDDCFWIATGDDDSAVSIATGAIASGAYYFSILFSCYF